ncbi:Rieske (2Fe-2S) protein [Streptomyces sp. ms191]|uniref:Rieske 2Fe-2S domain-containing protein n=1 Tax=Streptomyces sp. ms191 TaxID=1827978 RepID=UPI0011CD3A7E|nr:Rieske (2Fe-2S) protein [Streptomyces sp. ms191]TXS22876.1 Rieske (2Fe-2S) protein [Streptomyces sp. ms191]
MNADITLPDSLRAGPSGVLRAIERVEQSTALDGLVGAMRRAVRSVPLGRARDVLHGVPLGHPVHPLLVQVPIGAWLSSAVVDLLPGHRRAADTLIAVGLAGAAPAAVAGWADWAELPPEQSRVGLVHAAANIGAVSLYATSLLARLRGRPLKGRLLALAGLATVAAGGALGGHLAYRQASGANHAEAVPHLVGPGWHPVGPVTDYPVGRPTRAVVDGVDVVVLRQAGDRVHVLADRCAHMGGPLSQGEAEDGCIRCPWHGSVFRLADGWNVHGPSTAPQPSFDTRIVDGRLEARLRHRRHEHRAAA